MKKILNNTEEKSIENLIASLEEKTGAELTLAIYQEADPYPASYYRMAIFPTLFWVSIMEMIFYLSPTSIIAVIILSYVFLFFAGEKLGLKKFFLSKTEVAREVKEKACELFFTKGLTKTDSKVGMILLISLLERKIELVVDQKIKEKISQDVLDQMVQTISSKFKKQDYVSGLSESIQFIQEKILLSFNGKIQEKKSNELSNTIIWG